MSRAKWIAAVVGQLALMMLAMIFVLSGIFGSIEFFAGLAGAEVGCG